MRRRNREINIFSMSALDLFASAMGAFILIAVISLPYYLKDDKEAIVEAQRLKKELEETRQSLTLCTDKSKSLEDERDDLSGKLDQAQQDLGQCREVNKELKREASKTFIAVVMQWPETGVDIDLHVTDPQGRHFYYKKNNKNGTDYPDTKAKLSRDTREGPGVEVWEIPVAASGTYTIEYRFFPGDAPGTTSVVDAVIYTARGSYQIPTTRLKRDQRKKVAKVVINDAGEVSFQ